MSKIWDIYNVLVCKVVGSDFLLVFTVHSMNQKHTIRTVIKQELKTPNLHSYAIYTIPDEISLMEINVT